ncbi:MAG: quinolinate synthase NadA [Bacteroidota bacterium]
MSIVQEEFSLKDRVLQLKEEKNAVILAHYYQEPEIQEVADFVGDSLELAKKAAATTADIIVFAGVHFMAETAKILNPSKKVLLPDLNAGCSLADSCPPEAFQEFIDQYPDHVVVTYINCSAEVKAMSDLVCTSSNAERVINSIPADKKIIFAPDKNLGKYLIGLTGREMLLWDGACIVHEAFSLDKLIDLSIEYPKAKIIAHPESESHILQVANYIGSTSGMLNYVKTSDYDFFIVATEAGILHQMQMDVPHKTLIPAPAKEDNTCACSECAFMKMNTMQKLYDCLEKETPEIILDENLIKKAHRPIKRMMEL